MGKRWDCILFLLATPWWLVMLAVSVSSVDKCLHNSFDCFLIILFHCYQVAWTLYIFWICRLIQIYHLQIFSFTLGDFLFCWLFTVKKRFGFHLSILAVVFFLCFLLITYQFWLLYVAYIFYFIQEIIVNTNVQVGRGGL